MSRANYNDDTDDYWQWIRWRGAVKSAIKGKRGQAFLHEMVVALDSLPEPKLIAHVLEADGAVCAIGAVGKARGMDMTVIDSEDAEQVAGAFRISDALAREIMYMNDDALYAADPEWRFQKMRAWIESLLTAGKQERT